MTATRTIPAAPLVSIIVPARNEEAALETCLDSLIRQTGANFEIIVVDDHSTDRTREIANSFSQQNLRTIEAASLPHGWTGKNNALTSGSAIAGGEWLLFTDADTIHEPGSLTRAVREAENKGAALLSYSPRQIVKSFWEKAVMPVIFAELAFTFRPSRVSDPRSPAAAANGQYILITREAYDAVGGHAALSGTLLEDVALARAVKSSGRKIFFRYAADAVSTRMYRNFAQLREGWTKNLTLLFPSSTRLATVRALEFVLIVASLAISIANAARGRWQPALAAAILGLFLYATFRARIRKAHFAWDANLIAFVGLPLFSYLLLRSKKKHAKGAVEWKGRTYSGKIDLLATGH